MIAVFYLFVALGVVLLGGAVLGRLRSSPARARVFRLGGIVSALVLGGLPLFALASGRAVAVGPEAGIVASAYALGGILVAVGAAARVGGTAARLRRLGYLLLLVVAAVPSWVFLPLTILVPFAGLALVEDEPSTQLATDLPS